MRLVFKVYRYWDILRFQLVYRFSLIFTRLKYFLSGNNIKSTNVLKAAKIGHKVAVLAIYPIKSVGYVKSVERLVKALVECDYSILCISNSDIPVEIMNLFSEPNHNVIYRKNFGRDFGAYQAGINWLSKCEEYNEISNLILVNDTLLWFDNSGSIIKSLENEPWGCLFLNEESRTHAQSFCLHFSRSVFSSKAFTDFWERYLPSNYRRYAIVRGEIGLTNTLMTSGFYPRPVASLNLLDQSRQASRENIELAVNLPIAGLHVNYNLPLMLPGNLSGTYSSYFSEISKDLDSASIPEFFSFENWLGRFIHSDPPHRIGLHLSLLFGLPMKRDLYKFQSLANISLAIQAIDREIAPLYLSDIENSAAKFMLGTRKMKRARRYGEV